MPKRKIEEELIKKYKSKIKKLENKKLKSGRRRIIYSESESETEIEVNKDIDRTKDLTNTINSNVHDILLTPENPVTLPLDNTANPTPPNDNADTFTNLPLPENAQITSEPSQLDPEMLLALGDPGIDIPIYGENIHSDIAQRWLPLLRKGLPKEIKEKLFQAHQIPENYRLLRAPSLNPEIAAAVPDVVRLRHKKMETKQGQLGLGITIVSKAMSMMLHDGDKVSIIKLLSEGCRILTDLHHIDTQARKKIIIPCLDKSFQNIIQNEERDESLFGTTISEKLRLLKQLRNKDNKLNEIFL